MLEGIALTGDQDFDLFAAAYPHAAKHATKLFGARQLVGMLGEAAQAGIDVRRRPSTPGRPGRVLTLHGPVLSGAAVPEAA